MRTLQTLSLLAVLASTSVLLAAEHTPTSGKHHGQKTQTDESSPSVVDVAVMPHMAIRAGILTVDGMVAKARLNYEIRDARFYYFSVPGVGTAIVSLSPFPNAVAQPSAFHNEMLTVEAAGHTIELTSENPILGKGEQTAWVALDQHFTTPSRWPAVGFGDTAGAPYVWPGTAGTQLTVSAAARSAPPLPRVMVATQQASDTVISSAPGKVTTR